MVCGYTYSQDLKISGQLLDTKEKSAVLGANVLMVNIKDSTRSKFATTDAQGRFVIGQLERAFYKLRITSVGYKSVNRLFRLTESVDFGTLGIEADTIMLADVKIEAEVIPVETRGDTVLYNADAFKTNPDATAADLVAKMPGMVVSETGIEANGETVQQVLLDGKRFFGQDPLLALNTIPSEVVNKIEVFDQASEQSQFTGFDDGNTTKTMNVVTKEDKRNGQFGKLVAGLGTDDRYNLDGNLNSFKGDRQLTILGMANNINKRSFTDSDILGIGNGGGRGFRRAFGAQQSTPTGITTIQSYGINYSDVGTKYRIEGSYFFDKTTIDNEQITSRESFFSDRTQQYNETVNSTRTNSNHRLNMRMEYNFDSKNSLIFRPRITYQDGITNDLTFGETTLEGSLLNETNNVYSTDNVGYNAYSSLIYRHKFNKRGRTISTEIETTINNADKENLYDDQLIDSLFLYDQTDNNTTWAGNVSYTEPIGLSSQLVLGYDISNRNSDFTNDAFSFNSDTEENKLYQEALSSQLQSDYTVHSPSVSFVNRSFQNFFNATLTYQNANLNSLQQIPVENEVPRSFSNLLPMVMGRINISEKADMFFRYNTSTSAPSSSQLQEVVDNSDPLFYSIGNQSLGQSYTHRFISRLRSTNVDKNTSFSNFLFASNSSNYITNATYVATTDSTLTNGVVLPAGVQLSSPVNLDGYWNVRNNATWGFLVSKLKVNINATLGVGYTRIPGMANGIENISETLNGNSRLTLGSNINENVDFNIYYSANVNRVNNSVQSSADSRYGTQNVGGKVNLIFLKGTVFRSDFNYQFYNGVSSEFDTKYILWNMTIAKKFLKNDMAEASITLYDILKQNQSISQTVTSGYLEEVQSLVLSQYFMFTVTYTLRKFKK